MENLKLEPRTLDERIRHLTERLQAAEKANDADKVKMYEEYLMYLMSLWVNEKLSKGA